MYKGKVQGVLRGRLHQECRKGMQYERPWYTQEKYSTKSLGVSTATMECAFDLRRSRESTLPSTTKSLTLPPIRGLGDTLY
jgi:hypothetical protein